MRHSARDVAIRILDQVFGDATDASDATDAVGPASRDETSSAVSGGSVLSLTAFQQEGVERVRRVLLRRGGAILADSVGLGKTYMALALIEETIRAGGDAIIVVPASVRSMWRRALHSLEHLDDGWRLVSHTGLARGLVPKDSVRDVTRRPDRIVVVDEAHRFRNPRTMRYAALARLLGRHPGRGRARALLLTATPINNRAEDLLHLILLFARDDAFRDAGVPSLRDAFGVGGSAARPRTPAPDRIAAVVGAVVVRRTRELVSSRFGEADASFRFPRRALPRVIRYRNGALPRVVAELGSLELAVYALADEASASDSRAEPAGLILSNLLKRLDSSPAAFGASVLRLRALTRASLDAAVAGRILAPARRGGGAGADGDPLQLTLVELVATAASPDTDVAGLVEPLRRDLETLEGLRPGTGSDPKLAALLTLLDSLGGERALVFTEYRDTAAYLERALVRRYRVGRVDGGGAWLGGRSAGRRTVVEAFAPLANGRGTVADRERVEVLIATDVLAEGVNLQDARHLISYDMPWNPVRLMQRIGRVDRLGSTHAEVATYLFVPATGLEDMLGLMRRLRHKLDRISTLVGGEQADELLAGLAHGTQAPGRFDSSECDAIETLRTLWIHERNELARRRPVAPQSVASVSVAADDPAAALTWVVLVRDAAGTALLEVDREGSVRSAGARSVTTLEMALRNGPRRAAGPGTAGGGTVPDPPVEALRTYRAATIAALRAPGPLPSRDPAALLARRIRQLAAKAAVALDRRSIDRIDRVLDGLTAPLDPAGEERARSILDSGTIDLQRLLDRTERMLRGSRAPPQNDGTQTLEQAFGIQVLAALQIRVDGGLSRG